jgi:hypothetical protein
MLSESLSAPSTERPIDDGHPPTFQQDAPFFLPRMYPNRNTPIAGDIIELPGGEVVALSEGDAPTEFSTTSVEGFSPGKCQSLQTSELEYQLETRRAKLIAERTFSAGERWWINGSQPPTPNVTASDLTFNHSTSRTRVNGFLNHPLVDHDLGGVSKAKALFVATAGDTDSIVAVAVLDRPARVIDDYQRLALSRYASHPAAPPNTASWMLSRICDWARVHGYRAIRTYAGVSNDNEGTIYQASGFTRGDTSQANGSGYANREGRETYDDFVRRTYYRQLSNQAIRVPPHDTELNVEIPESHTPRGDTTVSASSCPDLSTYLSTPATRQSTTLKSYSGSSASEFISPDTVGLVDFERNKLLIDRFVPELPITDRAAVSKPHENGEPVPTEALLDGGPEPLAVLGAHDDGRLTTALVIHHARDLAPSGDELPDGVAATDHIVTSYGSVSDRGRANVTAWLLAIARDRAAYHNATLHVASDLSAIEPARRRAGVSSIERASTWRLGASTDRPHDLCGRLCHVLSTSG